MNGLPQGENRRENNQFDLDKVTMPPDRAAELLAYLPKARFSDSINPPGPRSLPVPRNLLTPDGYITSEHLLKLRAAALRSLGIDEDQAATVIDKAVSTISAGTGRNILLNNPRKFLEICRGTDAAASFSTSEGLSRQIETAVTVLGIDPEDLIRKVREELEIISAS